MRSYVPIVLSLSALWSSQLSAQDEAPVRDRSRLGHSLHGEAFDQGPREKPARMTGIGTSHFPITTSVPEAQIWFDQGHTLLHSYWYYEAERSFRWAAKLDPEAPMVYWGLARAAMSPDRQKQFLLEAVKRKAKATPRERAYIEAWEHQLGVGIATARDTTAYRRALEQIVLDYPDDIEAKAIFAEQTMYGANRVGIDLILKQVIAKQADHPGAHHYRIHNWDSPQGLQALDSCAKYGAIAPGIGHALHMPGHIYAGLGMWHEAAIALDAATRAEIKYMGERLVFPFNTWNYAHNRNYLSYTQEQLGMAEQAIRGAREILAGPLDPRDNDANRYSPHWQGILALTRALIKFERWDDILAEGSIPWGDSVRDKMQRQYVEAVAHFAKGNTDAAVKAMTAHAGLLEEVKKSGRLAERTHAVQSAELDARRARSRGDVLEAVRILTGAAGRELELRDENDDPPFYPFVIYNLLGELYLEHRSPLLAAASFDKTLTMVANDPFALSGLVDAHLAAGNRDKAQDALSRLLFIWSDADRGLTRLTRARSAGLDAVAKDASPAPQRNYRREALDTYGPAIWTANASPALDARDADGKRVSLADFRGKNVVLVFYLGNGCPHCILQLKKLSDKANEFKAKDTVLVAVSQDTPEKNGPFQKDYAVRLLSDTNLENARRFKSYDDFEEIPIHSTMLIDREGRMHWARQGGAPFEDVDFLLKELARMEARKSWTQPAVTAPNY